MHVAYSSLNFCCLLFLSVDGLLVFQSFVLKPAVHQAFHKHVPNKAVRALKQFFFNEQKKGFNANDH